MTTEHGHVVAVTSELDGDTLAADATASATVITLEDVSPFAETGGQAYIDDGTNNEIVEYSSVDPDADTMTIPLGLANGYAAETPVVTYPPTRIRTARVRLDDDDDAPLLARVPYSMIALLPVGIREFGGESVIIELVRGSWVIKDVLGEEPVIETTTTPEPDVTPPPKPLFVMAFADRDGVICDWVDPLDATDADLIDADIKGYQVEIVEGPNPDWNTPLKAWKLRTSSRARYATTHYKRRYRFRVRTVDTTGNKSGWVYTGPVRPSKTPVARRTSEDYHEQYSNPLGIDAVNRYGFPLIADAGSSAYLSSSTQRAIAAMDGVKADGTIRCSLTTGSVQSRIDVGVAMRVQDTNDFLYFRLTPSGLELGRVTNGTPVSISSDTTFAVEAETTYDIRCELNGSSIACWVDEDTVVGVSPVTNYQTETHFGLYMSRSSTALDNGESRFHNFEFTPYTVDLELPEESVEGSPVWDDTRFTWDDVDVSWDGPLLNITSGGVTTVANDTPTIDETFERGGDANLLSEESESGNPYDITVGSWSIEQSTQPAALMGSAVVMPVWYTRRPTVTDIVAPAGGETRYIGIDGTSGTNAMELYFDRPTELMIDYNGTWGSRSGSANYNLRFWAVVEDNGVKSNGNSMSQYFAIDGDPVSRWQNVTGIRVFYVDASVESPHIIKLWWGIRNDSGQNRNMTYRDLAMRVWAFYKPDYSPTFTTRKRPTWTKKGINRVQYRVTPGTDI
jgi:hypothetical protein